MSSLRRFLNLERPRAEKPDGAEVDPSTAGRFEGVERPGEAPPPQSPRSSGAELERFGPEPEPKIELVETTAGERPFTRCMRCGMDHTVFAVECSGCGASLDTEAQREFNERLWAKRQEEAAREARASEERRELESRARAELSAAQRAMGEELARESGRRERDRLRTEERRSGRLGSGGWDSGYGGPPLGLRLLQLLPDWRWQLGGIAAAIAVIGGLVAYGRAGHPFALLAAILLGILLVVPRWRTDGW